MKKLMPRAWQYSRRRCMKFCTVCRYALRRKLAEGHLLRGAGFGVHQAQVAERRGRQFLRSENLHQVHLEAAADQCIQPGLVARRVEEIAQHDGHAGLAGFERARGAGPR